MLTIEISTPDLPEDQAHVYECERDELRIVLPGLLHAHPDFTHVAIFPYEE